MGEGSERIATSAGSKDNGLGSCETYDVNSRPKEDAAFQRARWAKIKAQQKKAA
jgi:hypothetical protein